MLSLLLSFLIADTLNAVPFCPSDMVEVNGNYCPEVVQNCLKWDNPNVCLEFEQFSVCQSKTLIPMHFCIDKYEYPNKIGELPKVLVSWEEATEICKSEGKRLPTAIESTFACEGEEMNPYPYGYVRDDETCGGGKRWIDPWKNKFEDVDRRDPIGSHPNCVSPFGAYDMVAGVDEWVVNEKGNANHAPWISGLHGGHYVGGVRNRCRALTTSHEPSFKFYPIGFRCARDI